MTRKPALDMSCPHIAENTAKDFIRQNAAEVIQQQPPQTKEQPNMLARPDYGKVPQYLVQIKAQMQQQRQEAETLVAIQAQQVGCPVKIIKILNCFLVVWTEIELLYYC